MHDAGEEGGGGEEASRSLDSRRQMMSLPLFDLGRAM